MTYWNVLHYGSIAAAFTCLSESIILVIWEGELLEVCIEHIRSQVVYGCLGSEGFKAPRWYQFGRFSNSREITRTQTQTTQATCSFCSWLLAFRKTSFFLQSSTASKSTKANMKQQWQSKAPWDKSWNTCSETTVSNPVQKYSPDLRVDTKHLRHTSPTRYQKQQPTWLTRKTWFSHLACSIFPPTSSLLDDVAILHQCQHHLHRFAQACTGSHALQLWALLVAHPVTKKKEHRWGWRW